MSDSVHQIPRLSWASQIVPIALSLTMMAVVIAWQQPYLLAVALLAGPLVWGMVTRPQIPVMIVVGVLYANLAVVSVKFHGAPMALGMLAPIPLVLPIVNHLLIRGEGIVITSTLPWIVGFMALQTISMLLSSDPQAAWPTNRNALIEGLILYLILTNAIRGKAAIKSAVWALVAAGVLMGGVSCIQWATGDYRNDFGGLAQIGEGPGVGIETARGEIHQPRLCGPIGEQNRYAQVLLVLVPLVFCLSLAQKGLAKRALVSVSAVVILAACLLTYSRGAVVALMLVASAMMLMRVVKPRHVAIVGLMGVIVMLSSPQLRSRIASIPASINVVNQIGGEEDADGAVQGRMTAMLAATRVFAENPLFGVGPGRFNEYSRSHSREGGWRAFEGSREAHCLYLELAAENGIFGLIAFGGLTLVSLRRLLAARTRFQDAGDLTMKLLATGFFLAIVGYLGSAIFLHFSYARYFWLILACADVTSLSAFSARSLKGGLDSDEPS